MSEVLEPERKLEDMDTDQLKEHIRVLVDQNEMLEESIRDISLAVDDFGWKPLGAAQPEQAMDLDTVKKIAETCRALVVVNPLVKRGIAVRTSYIWGGGVQLGDRSQSWYNRSVKRTMGTTLAQLELERSAAADGNLFFLVDIRQGTVQRIPMWEISGKATSEDDAEKVTYYKRTYTRYSGEQSPNYYQPGETQHVWYPSDELDTAPTSQINNVRVDRSKRVVHVAFNRQVGWTWGVPDVFAVVFWSKAYKEYLENCATLARAYGQFAWKVIASTKKGHQRAASKLAQTPQRDPATGKYLDIGGTAVLGGGQDLQPLQNIRPVDFGAGLPLASLIAAGLEIPLPMLTSDPGSGNRATAETLDEPTRLAMEARQQLMDDALKAIAELLGQRDLQIEWPPLGEEPVHRRVQAIDMAGRTGMLYPDEWRAQILDALDIEDERTEPPGEDDLPLTVQNAQQSDEPAQVDPPSRGDHELRDEGGQAHTEEV